MRTSPVTLRAVIEIGIVVTYLLAIGTMLYGAAIPAYQDAASESLAEQVLSDSIRAINDATADGPPQGTTRESEQTFRQVALPETIDGQPYRVYVDNAMLRLEHPDPAVDSAVPLPVAGTVDRIEGSWTSTEVATLEVTATGNNRETIRLVTRSEPTLIHRGDRP